MLHFTCGHLRLLPCPPPPSPVLTCAHLHSPAFTCARLRSPVLTCARLRSPALTCGSPALTCTHLRSPVLTCPHLCSPALSCAHLCSPVHSQTLSCLSQDADDPEPNFIYDGPTQQHNFTSLPLISHPDSTLEDKALFCVSRLTDQNKQQAWSKENSFNRPLQKVKLHCHVLASGG